MKVLSIGSDRSLFNVSSESAKRQVAYGAHFDELNIVVFSKGAAPAAMIPLAEGVRVFPTQSKSKLFYGIDAFLIARHLQKPDIVTVQDPFEAGFVGWFLAWRFRAALHVQVHTDLFAPAFLVSPLNRIRRIIARFVFDRAQRIRVVAPRIRDSIEKNVAPKAPITVLPIYTDITKFKSAHAGILAGRFSKFATRFLVVARLEKEKNVTLAIESFAKGASHDSCLIVVGEGNERRALEERAARLGIASRVFFEGKTNPLSYYAACDCLLVPSRYEGYGIVIIEALAARKPVIATDVGIARDAGAIITDPGHFAEAIREWLESGSRIGTLQDYPYQSFEEYVEKYTNDIRASVL